MAQFPYQFSLQKYHSPVCSMLVLKGKFLFLKYNLQEGPEPSIKYDFVCNTDFP